MSGAAALLEDYFLIRSGRGSCIPAYIIYTWNNGIGSLLYFPINMFGMSSTRLDNIFKNSGGLGHELHISIVRETC